MWPVHSKYCVSEIQIFLCGCKDQIFGISETIWIEFERWFMFRSDLSCHFFYNILHGGKLKIIVNSYDTWQDIVFEFDNRWKPPWFERRSSSLEFSRFQAKGLFFVCLRDYMSSLSPFSQALWIALVLLLVTCTPSHWGEPCMRSLYRPALIRQIYREWLM